MNKPFLFIETPRAGKHNHRFIVPTDYISGDGILSQWADFARQKTEDNDYIGDKREAKQQSSGRTGWEQIILAGVNTKLLSKEQMEAIRTFLTERLPDVERLVTQTINWEQATKIIIPRPELNQWLQELEQRLGVPIPAMPQEIKSQIKIKSASKRRWYMELVIGSVIISGFSIWIAMNNLDKNDPRRQTIEQKQQNPSTAEQQAKRLIAAIGGNRKDVEKELGFPKDVTDLDNWKDSQAGTIPATGDWQLAWFTSSLDNTGRDLAQLWEQPIKNLVIKDKNSALQPLQPLVKCRLAIRKLMGIEESVHTPFFKPEDFGDKAVVTMKRKITTFAKNHEKSITEKRGCGVKPEPKESLLDWIKGCFNLTGYKDDKKLFKYEDDKELQNIKKVGEQCGAVFISPTAPQ